MEGGNGRGRIQAQAVVQPQNQPRRSSAKARRIEVLNQVSLLYEVNAMTSLHLSINFEDCGHAEEGKMQRWSGVTYRRFHARAQPHLCIMQDETGVSYATSFSGE